LFLRADYLENLFKSASGGCAARPHRVSGSIPLISTKEEVDEHVCFFFCFYALTILNNYL
jgi:hypothetical protein